MALTVCSEPIALLDSTLACRFHLLKPEYIHGRIRELQRAYALRVLLCFVDIDDVVLPLGQIIKTALLNGLTLICAWSPQVRLGLSELPSGSRHAMPAAHHRQTW